MIEVRTHQGLLGGWARGVDSVETLAAGTETEAAPFKVEILEGRAGKGDGPEVVIHPRT